MKITVWVVSTCIPGETEPSLPAVFASEAEAEAHADLMLRGEWEENGPRDEETDELLPYPGDWREAQDQIVAYLNDVLSAEDDRWGEWEITSHQIEIGSLAITLDGGLVQGVVTDGSALLDAPVVVIDYDVEGADDDEVTQIEQDDGGVADAFVSTWAVATAGIRIPDTGAR